MNAVLPERGRPPEPEEVYRARMGAVLDHIAAHLADPLDLGTLARVANFSASHFHRLFRAWQGETAADCVRRMRLEAAARKLLARPGEPVIAIALEVGMPSPASFSRAFRAHFGMTPSAWRSGGAERWSHEQAKSLRIAQAGDTGRVDARVEIVNLPAMRLAYLRCTGAYGQPAIGATWEKLARTPGLPAPTSPFVGIAQDVPEITPPARCRYDCCVPVPAEWRRPRGLGEHAFAGGRYARVHFTGNAAQVERAWAHLFGRWLPASGYEPADAPALELYEASAQEAQCPGEFSCWLCVPVRPLRR